MAVALQSTAPQTFGSGALSAGEPTTDTHTGVVVDSGTDRCLLVLIEGEGTGASNTLQVNSMTYGGAALTKLDRVVGSSWTWAEAWYLVNPTVGSADLVVTLSSGDNWNLCTLVGQGVDQTTPLRTAAKAAAASGTSASVTVTSVGADDLVAAILGLDGTGHNPVPGTGETEQMERDSLIGGTEGAVYTQPGSSGGAISPTWTTSGINVLLATAFIAAATGGTDANVTAVPASSAGSAPAAAATTTAGTDTLEYANGTLSSPWSAISGFTALTISGGAAYAGTDGTTLFANSYPVGPGDDQFCSAIFESAPANNTNWQPAVFVNVNGTDHYQFRLVGTVVRLIKTSSGTPTTVNQETRTTAINTITGIKAEVVGGVLKGYVQTGGNWVEEIAYTDASPLTGGGPGIGHTASSSGSNPQGIESVSWGVPAQDASVTAVPAVSAGTAPAPTVSANTNASVTAVPASSAGDAPAATIAAGATVSAAVADSVGTAPAPSSIISVVVNAPAVISTGTAPAPSVSVGGDRSVTAVPASSAGDAPAPSVSAGASVTAAVADSAGSAPAPTIAQGAGVTAVPALSHGSAPRPTVEPEPEDAGGSGTVAVTFSEES